MNKKVTSLVAVGIFLMSATPAFAAFRWGFSFDVGPFHFGDGTEQITPGIFPTVTAYPTDVDEDILPSHTVRPTRTEISISPRPTRMPRPSSERPDSGMKGGSGPIKERNEYEWGTGSRGATGTLPNARADERTDMQRIEAMQTSVTKMYEGYQKRLGQYETFVGKLKSRRDKMTAESQDVATLDTQIQEAEGNFQRVKQTVQDAVEAVKSIDFSADANTVREQVLAQNQKVREAFTSLYADSKKVVTSVKNREARPSMSVSPRPSRMMPSGRPVKEYENRRQTVSPTP